MSRYRYVAFFVLLIIFYGCSSSPAPEEQEIEAVEVEEEVPEVPKKINATVTALLKEKDGAFVFPKGASRGVFFAMTFDEPVYVSDILIDSIEGYQFPRYISWKFEDGTYSFPTATNVNDGIWEPDTIKRLEFEIWEGITERFVVYKRPGGYRVVTNHDSNEQLAIGGIHVFGKDGVEYELSTKLKSTINDSLSEQVEGTVLEGLVNNQLGNYSIFGEDSTIITEFEYQLTDAHREKYIQLKKYGELMLRSDMTFTYQLPKMIHEGNWSIVSANNTKAVIQLEDEEVVVTRKEIKGAFLDPMLNKTYKNYFVNIKDNFPEAGYAYDMRYATDNNFLKQDVYGCANCFLREDAANALINAQESLMEKGYSIKFFDCYRPLDVQKKMWEIYPHPGYVADPAKGSMHNRGAAVDITLVNVNGEELDMGTGFDHFGREAWHAYEDLPDTVKANRLLLKTTLESAGFRSIRTEWWHYSLIKPGGHHVANVPICID